MHPALLLLKIVLAIENFFCGSICILTFFFHFCGKIPLEFLPHCICQLLLVHGYFSGMYASNP